MNLLTLGSCLEEVSSYLILTGDTGLEKKILGPQQYIRIVVLITRGLCNTCKSS